YFSSRRRHTKLQGDWSSDVCSSDLTEIRLASRPFGRPTLDNFDIVETAIPAPGAGEIAVRNLVLSLDPYMRGRMSDAKSYAAPRSEERRVGKECRSRVWPCVQHINA